MLHEDKIIYDLYLVWNSICRSSLGELPLASSWHGLHRNDPDGVTAMHAFGPTDILIRGMHLKKEQSR